MIPVFYIQTNVIKKKKVAISVTVMPFSIDKYNSFEFKNIFLEGDNK